MNVKANKKKTNSYNASGETSMCEGFEKKKYIFAETRFNVTGEYVETDENVLKNIFDLLHKEKEVENNAAIYVISTS